MDQNPQPSTPAPPTAEAPWARIAAPPGSTQPPAEPSPPAPPAEAPITAPAPVAPPSDPWAVDLSDEEWGDLAQDASMEAGELKALYSPAREVSHTFGGPELESLLNSDDPVFGAIGNDANLIRGLASFGETLRTYTRDEGSLLNELTTLAQETGQPFTPPKIPPLQGKALDEAVHQLLSRHLRDTGARQGFESTGVFRHPVVRSMLERMARQEHRAVQSLRALDQQKRAWQGQRPQGGTMPSQSSQPQVSKEDLALESDAIWLQWREADQAGDMVRANMLKTKLAQIDKLRFGG